MERGSRLSDRLPTYCKVVWLLLLLAPLTNSASAKELSDAFLKGLREKGYYDTALDYLDHMESSRLASAEFRRLVPYHRGILYIEQARISTSRSVQTDLLNQAASQLNSFAEENPDRVEGAEARGRLAGVLFEQAKRGIVRASKATPVDEGALADARKILQRAASAYAASEHFYTTGLRKFPKTLDPKTEQEKIVTRREYRGRLAQVRILIAQAKYERAKTFPPDSAEFRKLNEEAAATFAQLFEKYSSWLVGAYAHLYEGRCYQALEKYQKALGCYDTIVAQPASDPAFRDLISRGYRHQAECLIAQQQYDATIASCEAWLAKSRSAERKKPEWLAVEFQLAEAYRNKAGALEAGDSAQKKLNKQALEYYRLVADLPGEFRKDAQQRVAELGGIRTRNRVEAAPSSFAEAYAAGKLALDSSSAAQVSIVAARRNAPDSIPQLEQQAEASQADALRDFRLALTLVEDEVDSEQLNEVRYYLSWLNFQRGEYYRAAILGEFVARRYPDHRTAVDAAKIAMASYNQLFNLAVAAGPSVSESVSGTGAKETEFEADRLARMAEFITRRWPDSDDAKNAFSVLLGFAIRNNRLDDAKRMLAEVAPERRAAMQLKLGGALWAKCLEGSRKEGSAATDLAALRGEAIALLTSGLAKPSRNVSAVEATSALFLVQAFVGDGRYEEAIDLLQDSKIGPLTLIQGQNKAAQGKGFASGAYRAALQAYVLVVPPQGEKAVEIMASLEELAGSNGQATTQAADRLTKIYIGLGVQLQRQIEALRKSGQVPEAERVTAAFAEFLDRVADRQQSANWVGRSWIARTYLSMGEGLGSENPRGKVYLSRARDTYQQMLEQAKQNEGFAPSALSILAAKKQLAVSLQKSGEHQAALKLFATILKEKQTRLDVQKAAAYAYQARGEAGEARWLERAIAGGFKLKSTGKNVVWGWAKIASVVKRYADTNPRHRETFFEAWLNIAQCRYQIGMKSSGTNREQHLSRATATVRSISQQYPDLGGPEWRDKFDQLAKAIQTTQGKSPRGLSAFGAVKKN